MRSRESGGLSKENFSYYISLPPVKAIIITLILLAIMLPYWWLAADWAKTILPSADQHFAFITTTFLLVLIIADSAFLVIYYQTTRKNELENMTEELKMSEEALLSANKKLTLLSGITRHDIKNQLTLLEGYIDISRDFLDDPAKMKVLLDKEMAISDNIDSQIDFTKDYEEMGVNAPVWNNLNELISTACSGVNAGKIKISKHNTNADIYADPLISKVFYNLIDNTIRHGGESVSEILISAEEATGGFKIIYEDNGTGISPHFRNNLFEKGYGRNTGLGLFLSKEILSITGISIQERGDNNSGVHFEIIVPADCYRIIP